MSNDRIVQLLRIERECVWRNSTNSCDRNCANCDLVQDDKELLEMYETVINKLETEVTKACWL